MKLEEHGSLWAFVNVLSIKRGDKDIIRFFNTANALHKNFYENEMPKMLKCFMSPWEIITEVLYDERKLFFYTG